MENYGWQKKIQSKSLKYDFGHIHFGNWFEIWFSFNYQAMIFLNNPLVLMIIIVNVKSERGNVLRQGEGGMMLSSNNILK